MFGGLNRLFLAALVAGAFFVAPSVALASGCGDGGTSAVNVYRDCLPSGGGGGGGGNSASGGTAGKSGGGSVSTTPVSGKTATVIKHAGKDGRALAALVKGTSTGLLRSSPSESETNPSAVGSAFDLGSGPTALLIALAGTAVLLLGATGVRGWRRSHRA
jgi:hypothetical protein